ARQAALGPTTAIGSASDRKEKKGRRHSPAALSLGPRPSRTAASAVPPQMPPYGPRPISRLRYSLRWSMPRPDRRRRRQPATARPSVRMTAVTLDGAAVLRRMEKAFLGLL